MRARIIGLTLLVSVLAITLFGLPLAFGVRQYALAYERSELERLADAAALEVSADLLRDTPPPEPAVPRRGVHIAAYEDEAGRRVVGTGPGTQDVYVRDALGGRAARGGDAASIIVAVPVSHDGEIIGAVRVAESRAVVYRRVTLAWAAMLALAVLALIVGWLLALWQASRLARPLEELAGIARRLGEGDFSVRSNTSAITEIDALGAALDSTAGRLDDLLARERAFSADASHQLRTPLTGLRLHLEAALDQPGDLRSAITRALADADRLELTIHELLTLAREDTATDRQPVDLTTLLADIEIAWRPRLERLSRSLEWLMDQPIPLTVASRAAVRQILEVLLDNATTHGTGTVSVRGRDAGDVLAIDVNDEGRLPTEEIGMSGRRPDSATGHGIGLALATRLAEAERGRLSVASQDPTSFTLLLPAVTGREEQDGQQTAAQ